MPSRKRERPEMDEEGARKKMRASVADDDDDDDGDSIVAQDMASDRDMERDAPGAATVVAADVAVAVAVAAPVLPSEDSQALQILKGDFDDLRQLITCKICERLLYEPFVISCGHTYCYSCLCTWFATTRKKTCPNCREHITQPPAPSYVIKEMTHIFIRRHDHLPDGETTQQHEQWKEEEADLVRQDRNDADPEKGGLFKGLFSRHQRRGLRPVHDPVDGVERCPQCNWEVEDGMCNNCGIHMDPDSDSSGFSDSDAMDDEEIEDDFDDEDADADPAYGELDAELMRLENRRRPGPTLRIHGQQRPPLAIGLGQRPTFTLPPRHDWDTSSNSNASLIGHLHDELIHDFGHNHGHRHDHGHGHHHGHHPDGFYDREAIDEDEDEHDEDGHDDDDDDEGSLEDFIDDRDPQDITTHTIDSQPDEEPRSRWNHRRPHQVVLSSDDENSDAEEHPSNFGPLGRPQTYFRPFGTRPVEISDDEDDDDDDVVPIRRSRPRPTHPRSRMPPRINISDSEDSEDSQDSDEPRLVSVRTRLPAATTSHRRRPPPPSDSEDLSEDALIRADVDDGSDISGRIGGSDLGLDCMDDPTLYGYEYAHDDPEGLGTDDESSSEGSQDEDDDISNENLGFSPMQSDEEDQGDVVDGYDVYGAASGESDTE